MPYIVTTKRRVDAPDLHRPEGVPERVAYVNSRRAVATLDERVVFNAQEWQAAGHDQPDGNLQFWHHALILGRRNHEGSDREVDESAEVLWLHDGSVSRGHLTHGMGVPGDPTYRLPPFPPRWGERLISESGGTVGPLPDGTVIEVEAVDWEPLQSAGGFRTYELPTNAEIIDAFNAREVS